MKEQSGKTFIQGATFANWKYGTNYGNARMNIIKFPYRYLQEDLLFCLPFLPIIT